MIETFANLALLVTGGLALIGFGIGYAAGRRERAAVMPVIVLAVLLFVGLLAAVKKPAGQIGPAVTQEATLIAAGGAIGLFGGLGLGIKRRKHLDTGARVHFVVTCAALAFVLAALYTKNRELVRVMNQLGISGKRERYEPEKNKDCPENLKSLYFALKSYAQDWDALPPAANWMDNEEVVSKVTRDEWLHCPAVSNRTDDKYGYALNEALAAKTLGGKPLDQQPDAAKTPLLYDSTTLKKSAHDSETSLPKPGRHGGRNNILYLDGHVEAVEPK